MVSYVRSSFLQQLSVHIRHCECSPLDVRPKLFKGYRCQKVSLGEVEPQTLKLYTNGKFGFYFFIYIYKELISINILWDHTHTSAYSCFR